MQLPAFLPVCSFSVNRDLLLRSELILQKALTAQAVGTAMEFAKSEVDLFRAYGVPRNLLVDFRILSKPYSVVRDVTLSTLQKLSAASEGTSQNSRFVLSMSP